MLHAARSPGRGIAVAKGNSGGRSEGQFQRTRDGAPCKYHQQQTQQDNRPKAPAKISMNVISACQPTRSGWDDLLQSFDAAGHIVGVRWQHFGLLTVALNGQ